MNPAVPTRAIQATPEPIVLGEYDRSDHVLSDDVVASIRRVAGSKLRISRADEAGRWSIETGSDVGTISVPGCRILVHPKVTDANLFHLLGVSSRLLPRPADEFGYGSQSDLVAIMATIYAAALEHSLASGMVRRYVTENERLFAVRGRIDVAAQLRSGGLPLPLHCAFDEYTEDIALNRVLVAGAAALLRHPSVAPRGRQRLHTLVARFDGLSMLRPSDLVDVWVFDRLSAHARVPYRLARLILEGSSVIDRHGTAGAATFLIDMNQLYEEFLEVQLRQALAGRLEVAGQRSTKLDAGGSVTMRPDLVFGPPRAPVFVGDAKYKLTESGLGRDRDYYQLLAYCTALRLPEGVLVYCRNDSDTPPQEAVVRHLGTVLHTRPLTISGSPAAIDAQIDDLAEWVIGRVAARFKHGMNIAV
ncbi:MAG: McrC family protein [Acidimicrobiales bacterium]